MTERAFPTKNVVPNRYRGVSVASVDCALDEEALRAHFLGREAYRRTRFVVVRAREGTALLAVERESDVPLFSPIEQVRLLAGPDECAYVEVEGLDTAIPSNLARAALAHAPGRRAVVVQGRYEHVSFILDPQPLRITVREVVPPYPPKLFDQASRIVEMVEDLHPVELVADVVDLTELARQNPAPHYLLPCRGSGGEIPWAGVSYLDERPDLVEGWTLIGCERSLMIHEWFYGFTPKQLDFCPKNRPSDGRPLLTKCCLQEEEIEFDDGAVSVPWGSSLEHVRAALVGLTRRWEPAWAPV